MTVVVAKVYIWFNINLLIYSFTIGESIDLGICSSSSLYGLLC
jgi:hypothetical protein